MRQALSGIRQLTEGCLPWLNGNRCCSDEVQWLHPATLLELLWDDSLSSSSEASQTRILQDLLQQALTGPLLPAQQQQVLEQLQANPRRVFSCGLTPQRLPDLVELNPAIAIEVCQRHVPSTRQRPTVISCQM